MSTTINLRGDPRKPAKPIEPKLPPEMQTREGLERAMREGLKFDPRQPRDRRGRWTDVPGDLALEVEPTVGGVGAMMGAAVGAAFQKTVDPDPPPIDADVTARVGDWKTAERYFRQRLGVIDVSFEGLEGESPLFFQQIAQATKDAKERFPVLSGPRGLKGVFTEKAIGDRLDPTMGNEEVWGTTGVDVGDMSALTQFRQPNSPVVIVLNEKNPDIGNQELPAALDASLARANETPYGLMMHELGHATEIASGLDSADVDLDAFAADIPPDEYSVDTLVGLFEGAKLGPTATALISYYGAGGGSPQEAWAEMFTTLNTPGMFPDTVPDQEQAGLREKLPKLRELANEWAAKNGIEGPII